MRFSGEALAIFHLAFYIYLTKPTATILWQPPRGHSRRYLPRYAGSLDDAAHEEVAYDLNQGHGETVLVTDDETTVRELMIEVLEEAGYTAFQAGDGASDLKILQSNARIDLLVTDVGLLGGMNGRQVADAARSSRPALKVLFVTGFAENAAVGKRPFGRRNGSIGEAFHDGGVGGQGSRYDRSLIKLEGAD